MSGMAKHPHSDPFYKPLWVRLLIVASTLAWIGFEATYGGSGFWLVLALAVAVYAAWTFIITFPRDG